MGTRTTRVLRAARLHLGLSRLSDPKTATLAVALTLGRLCRTYCPRSLETLIGVVRQSYEGAA